MTTEPLDLRDLCGPAATRRGPGLPAGHDDRATCTCTSARSTPRGVLSRGARLRPDRLELSGRVVPVGGRLPPPSGDQHLGAGGAVAGRDDEARLLEWDLVLPDEAAVEATARSLHDRGYAAAVDGADRLARDPWGTAGTSAGGQRHSRPLRTAAGDRLTVASWKMTPSVCRCPARTSLTPCRIVTR